MQVSGVPELASLVFPRLVRHDSGGKYNSDEEAIYWAVKYAED